MKKAFLSLTVNLLIVAKGLSGCRNAGNTPIVVRLLASLGIIFIQCKTVSYM